MGKNWGDAKLLGKLVEKPMLKEYPANDLLGVIKRMAYLEGVISALEDQKSKPLRYIHRNCRLEMVPIFIEPEDGVARDEDLFWRRNSGRYVLTFPRCEALMSDQFVIQHAESIAGEIWKKAQESALYHAHEDLENCRTRLKEVRETLLSDTAQRDIILRDEANAKA